MDLAPGDVVRLTCDEIMMAVEKPSPDPTMGDWACVWLDTEQHVQRATFPTAVLVKVPAPQSAPVVPASP